MRTFILLVLIVLGGCDDTKHTSSSTSSTAPSPHQFEIHVTGTPGVQLDMLLVWKEGQGAPDRLRKRITVPYDSGKFEGVACWAWFDSLQNGASGSAGDTYNIEFVRDGDLASVVEQIVKPDNRHASAIGHWQ